MKRVFLFLATNLAIIVVLSIVWNLLGVGSTLDPAIFESDNSLIFAGCPLNPRSCALSFRRSLNPRFRTRDR